MIGISNDDIAWCKSTVLTFGVYDDLDEMTGDALLALVKAARNFDPSRGVPFHGYANAYIKGGIREGVLKRQGYRKIRQKWERQHLGHTELVVDPDSGYRTDDEVIAVLQAERFDELLDTLSESYREVILRDLTDEPQSELMERDGVERSTISHRLKDARNKLRKGMFECNS